MKSKLEEIIRDAEEIQIISGEGTMGTVEEYTGKRTSRALKLRLTKERCNGDRWAKVKIDGMEYDI
jgi:hypothetical protein